MKFHLTVVLAALSLTSLNAFADTECTVKARNSEIAKQQIIEKSGLSLSECLALAEKEFGRKGAFNVRSQLFDIDLVRYTFVDKNTRTEMTKIVEGEITSHETSRVESVEAANTYKPRRDRCGGEQ